MVDDAEARRKSLAIGDGAEAGKARHPACQSDFSYAYPFRWVVPLAQLATGVCLLVGPFFFRLAWFSVIAAVQIFHSFIGLRQVMRAASVARGTRAAIDKHQNKGRRQTTSKLGDAVLSVDQHASEQKRHAFIVPNYKESLPLLRATLTGLSQHRAPAERYIVVLAMEEAEDSAEDKAQSLVKEFSSKFLDIFWTSHTLDKRAGEVRGKAANVSFAVRELVQRLETTGDTPHLDRVLVTVLDADALLHEYYTEELDELSVATGEQYATEAKYRIYAPPVVFERNWREVAAPSRVQDFTWGALASQNLATTTRLGFPLSVYSIPIELCIEMGFWDTGEEAIAEDMHTFLKAFYQTDGKVKLQPVYVPVDLVNLQDDGWLKTCVARVAQSERHYRGVVDVAFACKMTVLNYSSFRHWLLLGKVLEAHLFPSVIPFYMMVAAPYGQLIHWIYGNFVGAEYILLMWTQAFGVTGLFILVGTISNYERVRRMSCTRLFGKQNGSRLQWLAYIWLAANVWHYVVVPYIFAAVKWLLPFKQGEYKVAAKKLDFDGESDDDLASRSRSVSWNTTESSLAEPTCEDDCAAQ